MDKFRLYMVHFLVATAALLIAAGCSEDPDESPLPEKLVHAVDIPQMLSVREGQSITFKGRGFREGDAICFTAEGEQPASLSMPVTATTDLSVSFALDRAATTGTYDVSVVRGIESQQLGSLHLLIAPDAQVPDKAGATIKGMVHNDGTPLAGVRVSDGVRFATTDRDGFYWLESAKENGYVFVVVPSGYEPYAFDAMPLFWASLGEESDICEQHDFNLRRADNDAYRLIVTADMHMANRNDDLTQYETLLLPDIQNTVVEAGGKKVYSICLGDMSWDYYWYETHYALPQYKSLMKSFPTMLFHCMGNHDNDPWSTDDFEAAAPYRTHLGPTYYSFDLGRVHYVVLDNMVYVNKGGAEGTVGARDFNTEITQQQLDWLALDLEAVDKTTPIVVAMHVPMYKLAFAGDQVSARQNFSVGALNDLLAPFETVHCISGHTHLNRAVARSLTGNNVFEHNVAGACATWWWTGRLSGNHICRDGSVGGYMVFDVEGDRIEWRYKAAGQPADRQLRAYDLNTVKNYFATNTHARIFLKAYPTRENYASFAENSVLVNVWNWDETWTIRLAEQGRDLPVRRVNSEDPLHTLSYDIPRTVANGSATDSFVTVRTMHLFAATASTADAPIEIEVTDGFGRTYRETLERPKPFTLRME